MPQLTVPPQPSGPVPQAGWFAADGVQTCAAVSGTHWQDPGPPSVTLHVFVPEHVPQLIGGHATPLTVVE
jgi:hypothetical protein